MAEKTTVWLLQKTFVKGVVFYAFKLRGYFMYFLTCFWMTSKNPTIQSMLREF